MSNGLFGLKIFSEKVTTDLKFHPDPTKIIYEEFVYPNEVDALEICKMLDEAGVIKRLEKYKKAVNLLGVHIEKMPQVI